MDSGKSLQCILVGCVAAVAALAIAFPVQARVALSQELFEEAERLFSEYDFERARDLYAQALQQDPAIQWAHHQLGRISFANNELEKALEEFNQELSLHEDSINSLYMRGLTYAFLDDLKEAERDFREFVERKPDSEAGLNDLAYVLFRQNKFQEAEQTLQELLAKHPSSFLAHQGLAAAFIELDRFPEAEDFAAKAVRFAEAMDVETFQRYYPSLKPEHAAKGLETIQRGVRHNFNLVSSLQEGTFTFDEETPQILKPYFATASGGKYGAVFLAASCEADYMHTDECIATTTITSPSAGSWHRTSFSVSASDSPPSGTTLSSCWFRINSGAWNTRTCNSSFTVSAGSSGTCSTQGSNTCTVEADACTSGFGCGADYGKSDTRSFSIDYTPPSVGTISPTTATTGQAVTLSTSVSDSLSGLTNCYLYVGGSFQGSMTISGGTASRSHTFDSAGNYSSWASCWDVAGNNKVGDSVTIVVSDPPAQISVSPTSHDYGTVGVNGWSYLTVTVSNCSGCATLSGSVSGLAAPFSCTSNCSYSIAGGSSVNTSLRFGPTSTGSFSDIANFSGGGGASVSLSGTGASWTVDISASPSGQVLNGTSVSITGTSNLSVTSSPYYIRIYESPNSYPNYLKSCGIGTTCTYDTTGTDTTRTFIARIERSDGTDLQASDSISVTWQSEAQISVTPASLNFGDVGVNSFTQSDNFTVSNSGGFTVTGSVSGLDSPFSCSSGCSYSLSGGASQNTWINFSTSTVGSFSDTAVFSGEGGPLNRTVSGNIVNWVAGLSHSPSSPVVNGTSVTLQGTSNVSISSSPYYMRIYESPNVYPDYLKSCSGGTTCEHAVSDSGTTKTYTMRIERFDGTDMQDSDSTTVTWGSRDLIVQQITPNPANPRPDETITYTVVVKNQGALDSSGGYLGGYLFNPSDDCSDSDFYFAFKSLGTITAGATKSLDIVKSGGFSTAGSKTVYMFVDDTCSVAESNETNNELSRAVTVGTTQITDFSFDPTTIAEGQSTTVRGWLKDADGDGVGGKTVKFQYWGVDGQFHDFSPVISGITETADPNVGYTSFSYTPPEGWTGTVSYRLRFEGDSGWLNSTSSTQNLTVSEDNTAPTVSISGAPADWQNTNATAIIVCNDEVGGSGCEDSGNWKYMTPTSDPGTCPDATTQAGLDQYTGTYFGAFLIQEQRWMCATAADLAGNRGYTLNPVHFKIDKVLPTIGVVTSPDDEEPEESGITVTANKSYLFNSSVSDDLSGVQSCNLWRGSENLGTMTLSPSPPCLSCTASRTHTFSVSGAFQIFARCTDKAGN